MAAAWVARCRAALAFAFALAEAPFRRRRPPPGAGGAGGGETGAGAAKVVPWWSAALFLRLALAAAPRWRRRACPGAGCKGGGAVSEGEDTISSLSLVLPSEVVAVRVACPPASFILVKISSSQLNSSPILNQESELNVLELEELGS